MNYIPWRAIDKYHHYRGMRPDIRYLAREKNSGKSLVLVRGNLRLDYASAAVYNPENLRGNAPIYALDRNPEVRTQVLKAYPDRSVWIVNDPSITYGGFEVIEVPLSANDLVARENVMQ